MVAQIPQSPRHEVKFPVEIEVKGQRAKTYRPKALHSTALVSERLANPRCRPLARTARLKVRQKKKFVSFTTASNRLD
jgi:hypothetical protein